MVIADEEDDVLGFTIDLPPNPCIVKTVDEGEFATDPEIDIQIGDELVAIEGASVKEMAKSGTLGAIMRDKRPLRLTFDSGPRAPEKPFAPPQAPPPPPVEPDPIDFSQPHLDDFT